MQNQTLKYPLIAELLRNLEAEGFVFGTDKYLQLQELLKQLPDNIPIENFKEIFAPVICTNDKEQALFYSIFEKSLEQVKAVHEPLQNNDDKNDETQKWWRWILLLLLPVGIATAFLLYETGEQIIEPLPDELPAIFFTIQPDSTRTRCLEENIAKEILEQFAPFTQSGMGSDSMAQSLDTELGLFEIKNTTCIQYTAKANIGSDETAIQDSIRLFLKDSLGNQTSVRVYPNIEKPDSLPPPTETLFEAKPYPYPNDIRSLEIEPLEPWEKFYANNHKWLKPLFILLLAALLWTIIKYRDARRKKLIAELESKDKPPYVWNIKIDDVENIQMGDTFFSILNKLRQRTTDEFSRLDIPKTVKATIKKAGMADFQYQHMTRPPEYLLLIDQQSGANHRAHLFDFLYRAFKENEIIVERFFFDGDPRLCYNEAYPNGISLKELQHRYYNSRLLMMGNGYSLLSPLSGKLTKWGATLFAPWKQRSILTPRATESWGKRENRLQKVFHVLPATLQGLNFLVEQLDAGEDADFSDWKTKIKDAPTKVIELQGGLLTSLRHYFSEEMLQWIAACAVYPSLHWDLTLYVGSILSRENNNILTIGNIMKITRLPWFVEGEIPKEARAILLNYLEEKHPNTLQEVRVGLHELLQNNHPPKDSVAYEDYQMNIALNEWLFTEDKKRKKELEKEIAKYLEAGIEADFTVIKYLDRERTPLDFIVPNAWKKYVHKAGHVGLGMKDIWKDIFYWALPIWLVLSGLAWNFEINKACKESIPIVVNKENIEICIDQQWKKIIHQEWLTHKALDTKKYEEADSIYENIRVLTVGKVSWGLTPQVIDSLIENNTEQDSLTQLYKTFREASLNIATHYYNNAAILGNKQDQISKDSACTLFNQAYLVSTIVSKNSQLDLDIDKGRRLICGDIIAGDIEVNFGISLNKVCAGDEVLFSNLTKNATQFLWDFGDGTTSFDDIPTHTYQKPGEYIIKLTASNSETSRFQMLPITVCDPDSNNTSNIILSSNVFDGSTQPPTPLENVTIKGNNINTSTDRNGQYEITITETQTNSPITLTYSLEGYKNRTVTFTVSLDTIQLQPEYRDQDPVLTQQYNEVENLYNQTLATLQKNTTGKCKDLAEKNIQDLQDFIGNINLYPMEAAVANREQKNIQAVQDFKNKTTAWIKEIQDCLDKPTTPNPANLPLPAMTFVKGGSFNMGCTKEQGEDCYENWEEPVREVQVSDFSIGTYEVTVAEYLAFADDTKGNYPEWLEEGNDYNIETGNDNYYKDTGYSRSASTLPIVGVSWDNAKAYCKWLSEKTRKRYRLPTEAEWEYSARGGNQSKGFKFSGSNTIDEVAWYSSNSDGRTHSIAETQQKLKPNELGIYNMSGNVWEWIEDCWHDNYNNAPTNSQAWLEANEGNCSRRVVRGGSWSFGNNSCRVSNRDRSDSTLRSNYSGFRVAQD